MSLKGAGECSPYRSGSWVQTRVGTVGSEPGGAKGRYKGTQHIPLLPDLSSPEGFAMTSHSILGQIQLSPFKIHREQALHSCTHTLVSLLGESILYVV